MDPDHRKISDFTVEPYKLEVVSAESARLKDFE